MALFEDIVGAENIFGTDYGSYRGYPIVGADSATEQANQAAFVRQLAARNASAVMPRPVTKSREYPIGFPTTTIASNTTNNAISIQPQVPFRGRRVIIPSDIAGAVLINDIKVGKNSMLASTSGPLPGRMFSEFAVGVDLNLDTAQISQQVTLSVSNISLASLTFNAGMIGTAVE